jgi:hypothetical protein
MCTCIKAGILGGIVLFIWSAISWMVLPWHEQTIHSFKSGQAVVHAIKANVEKSGIYFFPAMHPEAIESNMEITQPATGHEPMIFASVHLEGMPSMAMSMVIGFINAIVAALLVAWLLTKATGLNYIGRVGFVVVFALAAGIITDIPAWNWFRFDMQYTLVMLADMLIGWFFAGLVMAKFSKN